MSAAKYLTITFTLLLFAMQVQGQNLLRTDSIKSWILEIKQLGENYPDSGYQMIQKLRAQNPDLSLEIEADLLKTEGAFSIFQRKLDNGYQKFQESGKVYQQMIDNYKKEGDTLNADYFETIKSKSNIINNLGAVSFYQGDQEKAVLLFIEASEIQKALLDCPYEPIRDKSLEDYAMSVDNIGSIYKSMNQFEKALEYRQKALALMGDRNDRSALRVKFNIAQLYEGLEEWDSTYKYAMTVFLQADTSNLANEYYAAASLLGSVHTTFDYLDSAKYYLDIASPMVERVGSNLWTDIHHTRMAKYYLKIGDEEKALENIQTAEEQIAQTGAQGNMTLVYDLLHQIHYALAKKHNRPSDYLKSVDYLKLKVDLNDSLVAAQRFKEFNELQSKYETEKKEAENAFLRSETELKEATISQQKIWLLSIAILFVAVLGLLIFQIRARRLLARQKELIQNQKNKLSELDASKSRFFANLSHDLRTPITLILGHLRVIGTDEGGYLSAQGELSRQKAIDNSEKLLSMSDEIRDLSSLEDGRMKLIYQNVKIIEYLTLLTSMFKSAADIKGISLKFHSKMEPEFKANLDPRQFEKIIYNLLSNALKFTEEGDTISIAVLDLDEQQYEVKISDTGVGIKAEQLPYIFDRYYQSPENEYRSVEGLGIGLSLVKELVSLHGGIIEAQSEPGNGTTFIIRLPKNLEVDTEPFIISISDYIERKSFLFKDTLTESKSLQSITNSESKEFSILVVDDHSEIREYIATFLLDKYNVFYANNGYEALDILGKTKINLVITDLMMPIMDGFELMDELKEKNNDLPIMVVSARTLSDDRQKILEKGVNEIMSKPFNEHEFVNRVANILTNKQLQEPLIVTHKDVKLEMQNEVLLKVNDLLKSRIKDSKVSVEDIAATIFASERTTFRMIKELTGLTPLEYITDFRLSVAHDLLSKKEFSTLTEISKAVGITSSTRFVQLYKQKFNVDPKEKLKK